MQRGEGGGSEERGGRGNWIQTEHLQRFITLVLETFNFWLNFANGNSQMTYQGRFWTWLQRDVARM